MKSQLKNNDFKAFFLLKFTKELISLSYKQENIENNLDTDKNITSDLRQKRETLQENKNLPMQHIQNKEIFQKEQPLILPELKPKQTKESQENTPDSHSKLPELKSKPIKDRFNFPRVPNRLRSIRPTHQKNIIDFKKLNPIINNPHVSSIECNGPNRNLIIRGSKGMKKSNIILSKQEIFDLLNLFSKESRIPLNQGMNRIAVGGFILSGVYNENNPAFILSKIRNTSKINRNVPSQNLNKPNFSGNIQNKK